MFLTLLHSYTGITRLHNLYISVANKKAICVSLLHLHSSFDSQGYHATLSPLPLRVWSNTAVKPLPAVNNGTLCV